MKKLLKFLWHYRLFSLAVFTIILGLGLQLLGAHTAAKWLISTVALIELVPLLWGMLQDVRMGSVGIDILAATAIIASVWLGQYWAAIVIVGMLTGGEALEDYAEHRARRELDSLLKHAPQQAHVIRKGKTIDIPVSQLHVGDIVLIKPGELVPVDATVTDGVANFDESSLTGESLPQSHTVGDRLLSGAINLDGAVTAKATASAEDSQYQQIVKLVRSAAASKAPFVRLAERYSLPFTFAAYAIAVTVWAITCDPIRFLQVIVVATPCPLLLAAPIALISGMSRASRYGIIVKNGSALEKLAEAETIAFDKTGTLTRGELVVDAVEAADGYKQADVLALAASLEQSSHHILAQAIVSAASAKGLSIAKAKHVREVSGLGLIASAKGKHIIVGRPDLLLENDVKIPNKFTDKRTGQTAVYVAADNTFVGVIRLSDELRPESKHTIETLHRLGIKNTMIITGDNAATAAKIAKQVGIDDYRADMLPAGKLQVLESVTARPLVFVGDGVNDAPALTAADVGVALGARGSTAASESADMVIMLNDFSRVAAAVSIAKRTFSIAQQSIIVGIVMSLVLMLIYATGKFSPLSGAIVQEAVDVVVIFNALRAHTGKLNSGNA